VLRNPIISPLPATLRSPDGRQHIDGTEALTALACNQHFGLVAGRIFPCKEGVCRFLNQGRFVVISDYNTITTDKKEEG
jgi:hypothetical protein